MVIKEISRSFRERVAAPDIWVRQVHTAPAWPTSFRQSVSPRLALVVPLWGRDSALRLHQNMGRQPKPAWRLQRMTAGHGSKVAVGRALEIYAFNASQG